MGFFLAHQFSGIVEARPFAFRPRHFSYDRLRQIHARPTNFSCQASLTPLVFILSLHNAKYPTSHTIPELRSRPGCDLRRFPRDYLLTPAPPRLFDIFTMSCLARFLILLFLCFYLARIDDFHGLCAFL